MTKTFATNNNNDLFIGNDGNLAIVNGQQAVLQACATAAKAQLGEMIYATNRGLPNFQTVWVGSPNLAQFEAALRQTLLSVNGVTEITDLSTSVTNNTLFYTATIKTIYGMGTLNGTI